MKLDSIAGRKILALLLVIIGLVGMATAWLSFIIIGVSSRAPLIEMLIGVTFALVGYMLWISTKKMQKALEEKSLPEDEPREG